MLKTRSPAVCYWDGMEVSQVEPSETTLVPRVLALREGDGASASSSSSLSALGHEIISSVHSMLLS